MKETMSDDATRERYNVTRVSITNHHRMTTIVYYPRRHNAMNTYQSVRHFDSIRRDERIVGEERGMVVIGNFLSRQISSMRFLRRLRWDMTTIPDGADFCLGEEADEEGKPLVRDCSCRGDSAGFAHLSCLTTMLNKNARRVKSTLKPIKANPLK
jgi:hypothetical protein